MPPPASYPSRSQRPPCAAFWAPHFLAPLPRLTAPFLAAGNPFCRCRASQQAPVHATMGSCSHLPDFQESTSGLGAIGEASDLTYEPTTSAPPLGMLTTAFKDRSPPRTLGVATAVQPDPVSSSTAAPRLLTPPTAQPSGAEDDEDENTETDLSDPEAKTADALSEVHALPFQ